MKNSENTLLVQGRTLKLSDIEYIKKTISSNPSMNRTNLSRELCRNWNWVRADGTLKDMSCRNMLLKLERRSLLKLPAPVKTPNNHLRGKNYSGIPHSTTPIESDIRSLYPLKVTEVSGSGYNESLFKCLLSKYHYLSFRAIVGENLKYLVTDRDDRPVACLLFGAAAWKTAPRDEHIRWDIPTRERNVNFMTNNTRFLILPWVKVPNLASCVLGMVLRRLNGDWVKRYGHSIYLVETFVDTSRFTGSCYKAANWKKLGETKGRTRQDRYSKIKAPVKDIYIYPLIKNYKEMLCR